MDELARLLADELKKSALTTGNEHVLPYAESLAAIVIAAKHQIAVLAKYSVCEAVFPGAPIRITVEKSFYHHLSQSKVGSAGSYYP